MTTARKFSVLRRRPGLIDLVTPVREGVDGYRLKTASNFDQTFSTTALTASSSGLLDKDVAGLPHAQIADGLVRMTFKPSNYSLSDSACWVQLVYVIGGVEQNSASQNPPSPPTLLLPADYPPTGMVGISGTAPSAGTLSNALRFDLPRTMENIRIRNTGGSDLFVAFDEGGPEMLVKPSADAESLFGTASSLWVRGTGACTFTMTCVSAVPR